MKIINFYNTLIVCLLILISCNNYDKGEALGECNRNLHQMGNYIKFYNHQKKEYPWSENSSVDQPILQFINFLSEVDQNLDGDLFLCPLSSIEYRKKIHGKDIKQMSPEERKKLLDTGKYNSYIYRMKPIPKNKKKSEVPLLADHRLSNHGRFNYVNVLYLDGFVRSIHGKTIDDIFQKEPALGNGTFNQNLKP